MILHYSNVQSAEAASLARRFAVAAGDNLMLVSVLADKWNMYVEQRDMSMTPRLASRGIMDAYLLDAICGVVGEGMVAVEAGAGFGYHTLLLCELVGPRGQVYAFEPHPRIYPVLKRNIELNDYHRIARPYPNALGAADGDGEMALHRYRFDSATLSERAKSSFGSANIASVRVSRLDDILLDARVSPDFYLLSAVGSEPDVWAGMQGLLASKRKVNMLVEFTHRWYADPLKFAGEILDQGFQVSRLRKDADSEPLSEPSKFTRHFRSWLLLSR